MVNEELRASLKQIGKWYAAIFGIETIILVDSNPGQFLPHAGNLVAATCQFFFGFEQF